MKKLVAISIMAAMLLTCAVAAMASDTDWLILMRASSTTYTGAGSNLQLGSAAGTLDGKDAVDVKLNTTSTTAGYVAAYESGASFTDVPPLYGTDKVGALDGTNTKSWDLRLWAASAYGATNLRLAWWTVATKALPTSINGTPYVYTIDVYDDPTGQHQGAKVVYSNGIAVGTSTTPTGYLDWTTFPKLAATDAAASAIKIRVTAAPVPEPSSMLALASGLFGMAGFAIRRRK